MQTLREEGYSIDKGLYLSSIGNNSGRLLFNKEFNIIMIIANIISQLPTVSPIFSASPTNSASKGEAPNYDCMVRAMPSDKIKIPNP